MLTPEQRGRRIADEILEGILSRLASGLGPVDLAELARRVAVEIRAALQAEATPLFVE